MCLFYCALALPAVNPVCLDVTKCGQGVCWPIQFTPGTVYTLHCFLIGVVVFFSFQPLRGKYQFRSIRSLNNSTKVKIELDDGRLQKQSAF